MPRRLIKKKPLKASAPLTTPLDPVMQERIATLRRNIGRTGGFNLSQQNRASLGAGNFKKKKVGES